MPSVTVSEIKKAICGLTRVEETTLGVEVSVPVFFPNGDSAQVVVSPEGDGYLLHDAASGVVYLDTQGVRLNTAARLRVGGIVEKYGCRMVGNRVVRRCKAEHLALAIMTVANASRTVADQALEVRRTFEADFKEAVLDGLRAIGGLRLRENQAVKGMSGRTYKVPAIILDRQHSRPVAFVSAIANRASIPSHLTELFDLKNAFDDVIRKAVYDESADLREEDRLLMQQVSDIVPFAQVGIRFRGILDA